MQHDNRRGFQGRLSLVRHDDDRGAAGFPMRARSIDRLTTDRACDLPARSSFQSFDQERASHAAVPPDFRVTSAPLRDENSAAAKAGLAVRLRSPASRSPIWFLSAGLNVVCAGRRRAGAASTPPIANADDPMLKSKAGSGHHSETVHGFASFFWLGGGTDPGFIVSRQNTQRPPSSCR